MSHVTESGLFAVALFIEPCLRIGLAGVGLVCAFLAVEVDLGVAALKAVGIAGLFGVACILLCYLILRNEAFD